VGDSSGLSGNAEFGKEFSGLKFVDIHGKKWISPTNTQHPLKGKELPFKGCKNLTAAALTLCQLHAMSRLNPFAGCISFIFGVRVESCDEVGAWV
jgi:hypothetical protein